MTTPFSNDDLLNGQGIYAVVKDRHTDVEQQASALSGQANALRTSLENSLPNTVARHVAIANAHKKLARQSSGEAKQAHLQASDAHLEAAQEIKAILPITGNSVASNSLMSDRAQQMSSRASNFTNHALQVTQRANLAKAVDRPYRDYDDGVLMQMSQRGDKLATTELSLRGNKPFATQVVPFSKAVVDDATDVIAPHAEAILAHYKTDAPDKHPNLTGIAGLHWTLANEHRVRSDASRLKASQIRAQNGGADNEQSRAYDHSALVDTQASQAHFTAGNSADQNAYSTSKVEGGWKPKASANYGNNEVASRNASAMSAEADKVYSALK